MRAILIFVILSATTFWLSGCQSISAHNTRTLLNRVETATHQTYIYEDFNSLTGQWRLVAYRFPKGQKDAEPVVIEIDKSWP